MLHKVIPIELATNVSCIFLVVFISEGVGKKIVLYQVRHDVFGSVLASHSIVCDIKTSLLLIMRNNDDLPV